jgi:Kdo2-lipid IVA lauroyltransferase/acyltransferase
MRKRPLAHRLEGLAIAGLMGVFGMLPLDTASAFGGWLGRTIGPFTGIHRKAQRQIADILPHLDPPQIDQVIRSMWDNLGRTMAEYPHLATIARTRVAFDNRAQIDMNVLRKTPTIFIGGHFANWEVAGPYMLLTQKVPMHLIYRAPNNPWVDRILARYRTLNGKIPTIAKSRGGTRDMIETMQNKGILAILIDQKYNEGIIADFFGRPAMSSTAFAQLGQRFSCPVYPAQLVRRNGAHFTLTIYPALDLMTADGTPRPLPDVVNDAHAQLDQWMRAHPEQWLWVHQRWSSKQLQALDKP